MGSSVPEKLRKPILLTAALVGYGIPRRVARFVTPLAIALEVIASLLLISSQFPRVTGFIGLGLLAMYSLFLVISLLSKQEQHSCGCFAFGHDRQVSWTLLLRNGAAALLTILPIAFGGVAAGWVAWLFAIVAAAVWLTLLALVDELGFLYELMFL